jgi:hypothetical protein
MFTDTKSDNHLGLPLFDFLPPLEDELATKVYNLFAKCKFHPCFYRVMACVTNIERKNKALYYNRYE